MLTNVSSSINGYIGEGFVPYQKQKDSDVLSCPSTGLTGIVPYTQLPQDLAQLCILI